ncbi:hypothetical protein C8A00DRAFT_28826 [Chaetomidium leptoderma]|uniref:Heterokaryon incompatibility domain-containing protein n=1 Tax=Chaetomidium leptoderma TaxID=669021 RepID=A0AAN7A1V4_9PEZI|nr:hypothetical protein C8A00DRAFT_28826 [Chaetomidium leptoderma]
MVELLLEGGARVESKDRKHPNPLHLAVKKGHELVVRLLLQRGSNIERVDDGNFTPLLYTAGKGRRSLLKLLLEKGANVSAAARGWSALCWAAAAGHEAVLEPLIAFGADVNQVTPPGGETPLYLAAHQGHAMVVRILLEHGARLDVPNSTVMSALSVAQERGHDAVVRLLSHASSLGAVQNHCSSSARYHYRRLQGTSYIRLLELRPASTDDEILSFDLVQADLDAKPRYQALSYEWGEKTGSIPVQCGDRTVLVTPNLKDVLRQIRSREGLVVTLWVDAVCINQEDLPERSQQVAMMARIFSGAEAVIMWLGDDAGNDQYTQAAFRLIAVFGEIYKVLAKTPGWKWRSTKLGLDRVQTIESLLPEAPLDYKGLLGLGYLSSCTYFTRAWILQEMVLASRGVVMFGRHKCDWNLFTEALWAMLFGDALYNLTVQFRPDVSGSLLYEIRVVFHRRYALTRILEVAYENRINPGHSSTLAQGVNAMVDFKAENPRDKVYAALGLVRDSKGNPVKTITPDYSLAVPQVYTMAARYLIKTTQNLAFWAYRNRLCDKRIADLPSWVPDWSYIAAPSDDTDFPLRLKPWEWLPASDLIQGRELRTTEKALHLDGHLLDTVVYALSITADKDVYDDIVLPIKNFLASRNTDMFDAYPCFAATRHNKGRRSLTNLEALWTVITSTNDRDAALTQDAVSFLAWRALTGDSSGQATTTLSLPQHLAGVFDVQKWDTRARVEDRNTFDLNIYKGMESKLQYSADVVITEKGYFAITGPAVAEPGMVIAVLAGADAFGLLKEKWEQNGGKSFYEYQDRVFLREAFGSLDDIDKGAKVERLEIR